MLAVVPALAVDDPVPGSAGESAARTVADETVRLARHLARSPRLLDDPYGMRTRLEELGVELQFFYNQYLSEKLPGGVERGSSFGHSASYDFFLRADMEALVGWRGLDLLLHVKGQYDRNVNASVGALSNPIDDADFDEPIYVDELYAQQGFLDDRLRLRAGFLEQQTIFDRNAYANSEDRQFLTTFLDNNPLVPLPNGLAVAVLANPTGWLELAAGAADADNVPRSAGFETAFDDFSSLAGLFELGWRSRFATDRGPLRGTWRLGFFVDGRELSVFGADPAAQERGHVGGYLSVDQALYREDPLSQQGLGAFVRWGIADPSVSRLSDFWSAGVQYEGLLPRRDADVVALAVYQAFVSEDFRDAVDPEARHETGVEVYYRIALLPWLAVTPDFQWIGSPGARSSTDDAVVLTLRLRVSF